MAYSQHHVDRLSDEQMNEIKEAFMLFDEENTGSIKTNLIKKVLRGVGLNPNETELQEMINALDPDGTDKVSFQDLSDAIVVKLLRIVNGDEIREAFQVFDTNGSGSISADELRQIMKKLGEKLTDEEVDEMIREVDVNEDGEISYDEFVQMMTSKNY